MYFPIFFKPQNSLMRLGGAAKVKPAQLLGFNVGATDVPQADLTIEPTYASTSLPPPPP